MYLLVMRISVYIVNMGASCYKVYYFNLLFLTGFTFWKETGSSGAVKSFFFVPAFLSRGGARHIYSRIAATDGESDNEHDDLCINPNVWIHIAFFFFASGNKLYRFAKYI